MTTDAASPNPPPPAAVPPASGRVTVKRIPERGFYDAETVNQILDAGVIAHVGVMTDAGPIVLPMAFGRSDTEIFVHGSAANHLLRAAVGTDICITVTHTDSLVLARTPFHHSMDYRCVVVRGKARKLEGDEKVESLKIITDHIVPRWDDTREPSDKDVKGTLAIAVSLTEASAKVRDDGVIDEEQDMSGPWWAGKVPMRLVWGEVQHDPDLAPGTEPPAAVTAWLASNND